VTAASRARLYRKDYPDAVSCQRAAANYQWLARADDSLRVPRLLALSETTLTFERVRGRHARPADLTRLAAHLGQAHCGAFLTELHHARLDTPYLTAGGHELGSFQQHRADAVTRELGTGNVPGAALTSSQARELLAHADGPAAFYKDANPRNFLITAAGLVTIDFDDLTLAPFGYDLAKLIVTLAMTYSSLPAPQISAALTAYNGATAGHRAQIPALTWEQLMKWAEIHHILTSRYLASGHYKHSWYQVKPPAPWTGAQQWP
jgi:Ser/Thr protein kinase RdoA (MazF antagonist)